LAASRLTALVLITSCGSDKPAATRGGDDTAMANTAPAEYLVRAAQAAC
jgi:hypothetical protein